MNAHGGWSLASVRIGVLLAAIGVAGLWMGTWLPGIVVLVAAVTVAAASLIPAVTGIVRARREAAARRDLDDALADVWTPPVTRARPSDVFLALVGVAVVALVLGGQSCRPKCQCITTPCTCSGGPSWAIAPP